MSRSNALLGILICMALMAFYATIGMSIKPYTYFGPFFNQAVVIVLIHLLGFIPSVIKQTEAYFDLTGAIAGLVSILYALIVVKNPNVKSILLAFMVIIWALRLGIFLAMRVKKDKNDKRFNIMKTQPIWFLMTWSISCVWVYFTQGPVLLAILKNSQNILTTLDLIGFGIWVFGFSIEVIADLQKRQFKALEKKKTPFITTGLWSISRHPNYFGELTLWFGAYLLTYSSLTAYEYTAYISYPLLALMLIKISGINLLEKNDQERFGDRKDYKDYCDRTACLVPWIW